VNFTGSVQTAAASVATSTLFTQSVTILELSTWYNLANFQINWLQQNHNSLARAVIKEAKFCNITPMLKSFHRLNVNECIEYELGYSVLTATQRHITSQAGLSVDCI